MKPWWHWSDLLISHVIGSYVALIALAVCLGLYDSHSLDRSVPFFAALAPIAGPYLMIALLYDPRSRPLYSPAIGLLLVLYLTVFVARSIHRRRRFRREERMRGGLCPKCGYNLTGNTTGVCPECGTMPRLETWESWGQWD